MDESRSASKPGGETLNMGLLLGALVAFKKGARRACLRLFREKGYQMGR